jgi:hypothetical protein
LLNISDILCRPTEARRANQPLVPAETPGAAACTLFQVLGEDQEFPGTMIHAFDIFDNSPLPSNWVPHFITHEKVL